MTETLLGSLTPKFLTDQNHSFILREPILVSRLSSEGHAILQTKFFSSAHAIMLYCASDFSSVGAVSPLRSRCCGLDVLDLQIEIKSEDLPIVDLLGKVDPYVLNDNLNLIWNQIFDFVVQNALHKMLILEVWNHEYFVKVKVPGGRGKPSIIVDIDKDEGLSIHISFLLAHLKESFVPQLEVSSLIASSQISQSLLHIAFLLYPFIVRCCKIEKTQTEFQVEQGLCYSWQCFYHKALEFFTIAPALVIPKSILNAGLDASQIDYYEISIFFTYNLSTVPDLIIALANQKLLGCNPVKCLNVHGGAISLGHSLGYSGASILGTLLEVMLGVDRLDMIKGIPQKILAFEKFLEENPSWRDKVVLLQIVVPTRTDVPEFCCLMLFQSYDYH
ncbi:hypothetical protein G4B88_024260 [Cannabis sativa]|uniref:C2 domain-containing protein n=1 Tax=Cannabis sativa TaxID=3483 RepID=A0A7J6DJQ4_CANSA|nr:hypothetical protein G4B88_024260 [Cannabis sativa]